MYGQKDGHLATIEEIRAYADRVKKAGDTMKDHCAVIAKRMATVLEAAMRFPSGDLHVDVYKNKDESFLAQFSTKVEHTVYNVNGSFSIVGDPGAPVVATMAIGGSPPFGVNDDEKLVAAFATNLVKQVRASATFRVDAPHDAESRVAEPKPAPHP